MVIYSCPLSPLSITFVYPMTAFISVFQVEKFKRENLRKSSFSLDRPVSYNPHILDISLL